MSWVRQNIHLVQYLFSVMAVTDVLRRAWKPGKQTSMSPRDLAKPDARFPFWLCIHTVEDEDFYITVHAK